jgi:hypothetical protein
MYFLIITRQLLRRNYHSKEYTSNYRRIVGRVALYAVRVVSEENRLLVLPRTSCILCVFRHRFNVLWMIVQTKWL